VDQDDWRAAFVACATPVGSAATSAQEDRLLDEAAVEAETLAVERLFEFDQRSRATGAGEETVKAGGADAARRRRCCDIPRRRRRRHF